MKNSEITYGTDIIAYGYTDFNSLGPQMLPSQSARAVR